VCAGKGRLGIVGGLMLLRWHTDKRKKSIRYDVNLTLGLNKEKDKRLGV
jgi:hypothetical protein